MWAVKRVYSFFFYVYLTIRLFHNCELESFLGSASGRIARLKRTLSLTSVKQSGPDPGPGSCPSICLDFKHGFGYNLADYGKWVRHIWNWAKFCFPGNLNQVEESYSIISFGCLLVYMFVALIFNW